MTQLQSNNLNRRLRTQPMSCHTQHVYPSRQTGALDNAVLSCIAHFFKFGHDIQPISSWLLYSVNHWCLDKEVLVILTQDKLWIVRYNWIVGKVKKHKIINLTNISGIQVGTISKRQMKLPMIGKTLEEVVNPYMNEMDNKLESNPYSKEAIRIYVNNSNNNNSVDINLGIRPNSSDLKQLYNNIEKTWNPFSDKTAHFTFKSHIVKEDVALMVEEPVGQIMDSISIPETRSINNFIDTLEKTFKDKNIIHNIIKKNIEYDNATGVAELIYNRNQLGSCRRRGNFIW